MRTAIRSDAPSASESGTSRIVDETAMPRDRLAATTAARCSTHATSEIAAATTTPHATHCSRARSCALRGTRGSARCSPTTPTTAHRPSPRSTIGVSDTAGVRSTSTHREHHRASVAQRRLEPARRACAACRRGARAARCRPTRGEQRDGDARASRRRGRARSSVATLRAPSRAGAEQRDRADERADAPSARRAARAAAARATKTAATRPRRTTSTPATTRSSASRRRRASNASDDEHAATIAERPSRSTRADHGVPLTAVVADARRAPVVRR